MLFAVPAEDSRQGVDDTNEESWNDPNFFDEEASQSHKKIDSDRGSVAQHLPGFRESRPQPLVFTSVSFMCVRGAVLNV